MDSPTMGAWECRHDVDGRDECYWCTEATPEEDEARTNEVAAARAREVAARR